MHAGAVSLTTMHSRGPFVRGLIEPVHPVLMARDVATSARFFATLGFDAVFQDDAANPQYAAVRRDGVELHLQWADPGQWAHAGDRPAYRFHVRDVDALYAEFRAAGVGGEPASGGGPWSAPAETPWETREFHVRDPGGNVLQFYRMRGAGDPPTA